MIRRYVIEVCYEPTDQGWDIVARAQDNLTRDVVARIFRQRKPDSLADSECAQAFQAGVVTAVRNSLVNLFGLDHAYDQAGSKEA